MRAPFEPRFKENGCFEDGFDYLGNCRLQDAAWENAKAAAPPFEEVPNSKAGEVREWFHASAFHAFDGVGSTYDYDGPIGFTPTHFMPLPDPPA